MRRRGTSNSPRTRTVIEEDEFDEADVLDTNQWHTSRSTRQPAAVVSAATATPPLAATEQQPSQRRNSRRAAQDEAEGDWEEETEWKDD